MTISSGKAKARSVDVLPPGRRVKEEGEFVLIEVSKDVGAWYHLSPPPDTFAVAHSLARDVRIQRRVDDLFLIGTTLETTQWVKFVPPVTGTKTYFQVMKVQHETIILRPDMILIRYKRDGTFEWVRNIQVAEVKRVDKKAYRKQAVA